MGALTAAMREYEEGLSGAGIRATCDPRSVNPVCVLILPPPLTPDFMCGGTATFTALVVGPAPANLDSWTAIEDLAEQVAVLIDINQVTPSSYQADENTPALPALQLTWTRSIEWPNPEGN